MKKFLLAFLAVGVLSVVSANVAEAGGNAGSGKGGGKSNGGCIEICNIDENCSITVYYRVESDDVPETVGDLRQFESVVIAPGEDEKIGNLKPGIYQLAAAYTDAINNAGDDDELPELPNSNLEAEVVKGETVKRCVECQIYDGPGGRFAKFVDCEENDKEE